MENVKEKFVEIVRKSDYGTQKYINHCLGVYDILIDKKCPKDVCIAGLYHSIYGTCYFNINEISESTDRDIIKNQIGEYAENLVYEMCTLPDRDNDVLNNVRNYDHHTYKDIVEICLANLLEIKNSENPPEIKKYISQFQLLQTKLSDGNQVMEQENIFNDNVFIFDDYIDTASLHHLWKYVTNSNYIHGFSSGLHYRENDQRLVCKLSRKEMCDLLVMNALKRIVDESKIDLFLGDYYFSVYNKGTTTYPHTDSSTENTVTILVFCNTHWDEMWGGDLKVYQKQESGQYLNRVIDFVPGRIVIFDSRIEHKVLSLSSLAKMDRFSLAIKCSTDKGLNRFVNEKNINSDNIIKIANRY